MISRVFARRPSHFALVLIAVLGVAFAAIVPPFQVPDEHAHFIRAYEIARAHWVGASRPALPADVVAMVRRYPERLEWTKKLNVEDSSADPFSISGDHYWLPRGIIAANVYCPVAYLPASAAIALTRAAGLPPLGLFYAARMAGVALLVMACWLAFRLAPESWWTIAAVGLLPTTLHQASGVTADVMTIGASFVVVASLLWLREHAVCTRSMIWVGLVFVLLVLCKISPWAFAALLLIRPRAFSSKRAWFGYIVIVAVAMLAAMSVWQVLSRESVEAFRATRLADGIDMTARARYVLTSPLAFAASATWYFVRHFPRYVVMFMSGFGWTRFYLPLWIEALSLLVLITVAGTSGASKPFLRWERLMWAGVFAIGVVFVHTVLYVSDGFDGIQGRYFIPFCLFGLMAIGQTKWAPRPEITIRLLLSFGMAHGVLAIIWFWGAYYR
jgi:uncharacterized membrane protein